MMTKLPSIFLYDACVTPCCALVREVADRTMASSLSKTIDMLLSVTRVSRWFTNRGCRGTVSELRDGTPHSRLLASQLRAPGWLL